MVEPVYRRLGLLIRYWRLERGMTQQQLADRMRLLRTSICNIETGRQRFLLHDALAFCRILRMPSRVFFAAMEGSRATSRSAMDSRGHRKT
jgi:transcriptional regulator with XRE-family HTH domain